MGQKNKEMTFGWKSETRRQQRGKLRGTCWAPRRLIVKAVRFTGCRVYCAKPVKRYRLFITSICKEVEKYSEESNHVLFLSLKRNLCTLEREGWSKRWHCKELLLVCWLNNCFLQNLMGDKYIGEYLRYCSVNFPGCHNKHLLTSDMAWKKKQR